MNIQRVLAVVSAVMIVCAVALATQEVHPQELGQLLSAFDAGLPARLQAPMTRWFGNWVWHELVTPLLQRPAWLLPAALAILAAGLAVSMFGRKTANRSRRRS